MNKERVRNIIDNRIISLFQEGVAISSAIDEIRNRSEKFFNILEKEDVNIFQAITEPETISSTRQRYAAFYITEASRRIEDLNWMYKNKNKFRHLENSKFFKLLQFRDKISEENALPF
jgi:hypothetical protein